MPAIQETKQATEKSLEQQYVFDITEYESPSPRITGIQKLRACGCETPHPVFVLGHAAFEQYKRTGLNPGIKEQISRAFEKIRQTGRGAYIGRAIWLPSNENPQGLRTSAIYDNEQYLSEIEKFFQFVINNKQDVPGADIALVLHPFIHAAEPLMSENPPVEFPGGAVTPLPKGPVEISATFGPDESVQGFSHDNYEARVDSLRIEISKRVPKKTETLRPGKNPGKYERTQIPKEYQKRQVLSDETILKVLTDYLRLSARFGPHRLEFIMQPEGIIYRECQPFTTTPEELIHLKTNELVSQVLVINSEEDVKRLNSLTKMVHLPAKLFQERRIDIFAQTAAFAYRQGADLHVLSHGSITTSHMLRIFSDLGFTVLFTGESELKDGQRVKIFRFDGQVKWETIRSAQETVIPLTRQDMETTEVGQKALNLHTLAENGFNTPRGFALATDLFTKYINRLGLEKQIRELNGLEGETLKEALDQIRTSMKKADLDPEDQATILKEAEKLGTRRFSVRSSSNVEDLAVAFAGQFQSFIGVPKEKVLESVKKCWASVFDLGPISYARAVGIEPERIRMGVLIHKTIEGKRTGVLFTQDRQAGNFLISVSQESSGAIVGGQAKTLHQVEIDAAGQIVKQEIKTPKNRPILSIKEINNLVRLGRSIAELFGSPQDVEWVLEGKTGRIYFLQARPV